MVGGPQDSGRLRSSRDGDGYSCNRDLSGSVFKQPGRRNSSCRCHVWALLFRLRKPRSGSRLCCRWLLLPGSKVSTRKQPCASSINLTKDPDQFIAARTWQQLAHGVKLENLHFSGNDTSFLPESRIAGGRVARLWTRAKYVLQMVLLNSGLERAT